MTDIVMKAVGCTASEKTLTAAERVGAWILLAVGSWAVVIGTGLGIARFF